MKHLKSAAEVERILAWRTDDFGHDTHALLVAESQALQEVGNDYLTLRAEKEKLHAILSELIEMYDIGFPMGDSKVYFNKARAALDEVSK